MAYLIDETAFRFTPAGAGASSSILLDAFKRYEGIIGLTASGRKVAATRRASSATSAAAMITSCSVTVASANETLALETDESYVLTVGAPTVTISAPTVFGALNGLESLSQLITRGLEVNGTTITDHPRYQVRDATPPPPLLFPPSHLRRSVAFLCHCFLSLTFSLLYVAVPCNND